MCDFQIFVTVRSVTEKERLESSMVRWGFAITNYFQYRNHSRALILLDIKHCTLGASWEKVISTFRFGFEKYTCRFLSDAFDWRRKNLIQQVIVFWLLFRNPEQHLLLKFTILTSSDLLWLIFRDPEQTFHN